MLDLVAEHGTPLFVYDEDHLRAACREAVEAWGDGVAYATKAFLCVAMARLAHEEGMCLDVSTGGELHVALTAGVPADRLVLHGNNKSTEELAAALSVGVGRIIVDSFDEIDRIERAGRPSPGRRAAPTRPSRSSDGGRGCWPGSPRVSRSTPTSSSAPARRTRSSASAWPSGAAALAVERLEALDAAGLVEFVGIHAHLGSQVFALEPFTQAIDVLAGFFAPLGLPELVVGGGLGVAYVNGEQAPPMAEWATSVRAACRRPASPTPYGSPPSRAARSSPRPASPCTGSGRSRTSPGTAPTCRSTVA